MFNIKISKIIVFNVQIFVETSRDRYQITIPSEYKPISSSSAIEFLPSSSAFQ